MKLRFFIVLALLVFAPPVFGEALKEDLFQIEYRAGDEAVARRSAEVLQTALREFGGNLPPGAAPVRVVIAKTLPEFMNYARRFGALNVAGVARPDQSLIAVKAPYLLPPGADYNGTLRHELVHILLYRNSHSDHLPHWLNEGIAMSLANEHRWASTLQVARMYLSDRIIEYRYLDYMFQSPGDEMDFNDAYAQALSMTRFMRNRMGETTFWAVVRGTREMTFGDSLRHHFGRSPGDLWDTYRRSLWKFAIIGVMVSGSFFTPAAILVILVWFRKRRQNRVVLERWAVEEAEDAAAGVEVFNWDAIVEDPDAWKQGTEREEE